MFIIVLPLCHVYELFKMDIMLVYSFDSQCLTECCHLAQLLIRRIQLEKESSRRFSRTIYFGRSKKCIDVHTVNVMPASYIFFNSLKIALSFIY